MVDFPKKNAGNSVRKRDVDQNFDRTKKLLRDELTNVASKLRRLYEKSPSNNHYGDDERNIACSRLMARKIAKTNEFRELVQFARTHNIYLEIIHSSCTGTLRIKTNFYRKYERKLHIFYSSRLETMG